MATRGIILACFVLLSAALVVEKNIPYTCQEGTNTLEAPFGAMDPHCDQSWTTGNKAMAYYKNGKGECRFPCTHVFSGKVILRECPDVILTTGCTTKDGVYEETRIHFSVITRPTVSMTTTNTANKQFYGLGAFLILSVSMIIQFVL